MTSAAPLNPADQPIKQRILAFALMCLGFFMATLDIQIVASSLKDIGGVGQTTAYSFDANGNRLTVTDPLAPWLLAARIVQSSIHLSSLSVAAVNLRFAAFAAQVVIAVYWTLSLFQA